PDTDGEDGDGHALFSAAHHRQDATEAAAGDWRVTDRAGAATYLHASIDTIDRLIGAGQLPTVRLPVERTKNGRGQIGVGRRILIDRADLDLLIQRSKDSSTAAPITSMPTRRRA